MVLNRTSKAQQSNAQLNDTRVLVASLFLPYTVQQPNEQHSPLHSPRKKHQKAAHRLSVSLRNMEITQPPSQYLFRTDSDPTRMPYSKAPDLTVHLKPHAEEFLITNSNAGNIGLHKAIESSLLLNKNRLYIGVMSDVEDQDLLPQEDVDQITSVLQQRNCVPILVSDLELHGHYNKYCKDILWPTLHYVKPTTSRLSSDDGGWKHYVDVNQKFADKIVELYKEGDIIWIHDYHLMLVPMLVRMKLGDAAIGFFLHLPFPSSEVFRALSKRRQLLEGVLGADLLGFQTYLYCRHFLQTASRILQCESTPKGILLENTMVACSIHPIGIDAHVLNLERKYPDVLDMITRLSEKYKDKKLIVARDKLDQVKGVKQKLQAFELFLETYPEWATKVVLVQVASLTTEHMDLQRQISDLVSRINSKFGTIEYTPVVYLYQDISFSHYLALLTIADACLITSLRDGMNLTSHEYVACQEMKHSPLILSEFAGTYGSFGAAIRINPWNIREVCDAINEALTMPEEERCRTHKELYRHVMHNSGAYWAEQFCKELMKVTSDMQRRCNVHNIPHLNPSLLTDLWPKFERRFVLLNYDGVLVPFERHLQVDGMQEPQIIPLELLKRLAEDPQNIVCVVSGRTKTQLDQVFNRSQAINFSAENGAFIRLKSSDNWESMYDESQPSHDYDIGWRQKVMTILEYYTERTPGSFIEVKETALVWHYRTAHDSAFGQWQAKEMQNHISDSLENMYPIHAVSSDRKSIEVRPKAISKVNAVKSFLSHYNTNGQQLVLYVGNDRSDEDVFEYLHTKQKDLKPVTTIVGFKSSHAGHFLTGVSEVLSLLSKLTEK